MLPVVKKKKTLLARVKNELRHDFWRSAWNFITCEPINKHRVKKAIEDRGGEAMATDITRLDRGMTTTGIGYIGLTGASTFALYFGLPVLAAASPFISVPGALLLLGLNMFSVIGLAVTVPKKLWTVDFGRNMGVTRRFEKQIRAKHKRKERERKNLLNGKFKLT